MIQALTLPGALAVMQKQALECSLQNVQASPDADKQLKRLIEGKEVLVYVAEINDSRFVNFIIFYCNLMLFNHVYSFIIYLI